jgi:hypothetical protein
VEDLGVEVAAGGHRLWTQGEVCMVVGMQGGGMLGESEGVQKNDGRKCDRRQYQPQASIRSTVPSS